jgi:hypothetical protein
MENRKPMLVQIASGQDGKQCDLFPYGSLHKIEKDEQTGQLFDKEGTILLLDFNLKEVNEAPTKICVGCSNIFPQDWVFISDTTRITCVRCYERKYLPNRGEYRKAVMKELELELKLSNQNQ